MGKKLGLALALAALLPFGCKCLSSDQTEPPAEQDGLDPDSVNGPRQADLHHPRMIDPRKARTLKFGDRLRLAKTQPLPPLGSGLLQPGAHPASQPATQPSSQAASQPAAASTSQPAAPLPYRGKAQR